MELTVNQSDFVRELGFAQKVVEKKNTIPILSNVLIEARDGQVLLTATDLELGLRSACPAAVGKEGSVAVPAKKLLDYVRLLPDNDIQIKLLENDWLQIICGRSRTKIAGLAGSEFPELPAKLAVQVEIPAGLFYSMISRTIFAITTEESRFSVNGALLLLKPSSAVMVSTNGHRLALVEVEIQSGSEKLKVLVPKKALVEVMRLSKEHVGSNVGIAVDENHLFFEFGSRLLISRKLTGNFPDYERVLPKDNMQTARLSRDEIKAALERVGKFADERAHAVSLRFTPGEVKVFTSTKETWESEDGVSADYDGPEIDIKFNAQYLLDFLRAVPDEEVCFRLKDEKSVGELVPAGESESVHYRYIVMPMRV